MKLIIATHNAHKAGEFQRILAPLGIEAVTQDSIGVTVEADETADSFAGNSLLKAKAVFDKCGLPTVADDSGLAVDALGGAPGVYSARYGEADGIRGLDDKGRTALLLERMRDVPDGERAARFVCSITLLLADGEMHTFEGVCEGTVGWEPKGENGFGYDPVFMVGERSFSELPPAEKDALSHRGKALCQLAEFFAAQEKKEKRNSLLGGVVEGVADAALEIADFN